MSALALDGFGVCFGRRLVLADVSLYLPDDGIDVLMGPVKTGKSTLMRALAGLNNSAGLYRQWGTAELRGQPVRPGWRPALVQQHAAMLNATLGEAVVLRVRQQGLRPGRPWPDVAAQALTTHGLGTLLPQLDESVLALPLEWQRAVNVLSYVLTGPPLLMIDEPTYGLDELAAARLIDWLRALGEQQRLFVTLHHQGQARRLASRVVLLAGGRVLAHDEAERFFGRPPNAWAEQFVRTGSLAVPSPGARLEDLSPDVEPPPALSEAAREALAEFDDQDGDAPPAAAAPSGPPAVRAAAPAVAAAEPDEVKWWEVTIPIPAAMRPVRPKQASPEPAAAPAAQRAPVALARPPSSRVPLPPLSVRGVELAAQVGRAPSEYRAPPGFHWIIAGRLAGCAEPGVTSSIDYDLDLLQAVGISYLITLTEKDLSQDALARHGLANLHLPIYDREAPSIAQIYMLVRRMQALMDSGHVVAVHCKAGIGRTGTVLAAWLIREGGLNAQAAIDRLRLIKPTYVQSEVQEQFLHAFEHDILQRQ
jgi:atypical dual specificity phosphatase